MRNRPFLSIQPSLARTLVIGCIVLIAVVLGVHFAAAQGPGVRFGPGGGFGGGPGGPPPGGPPPGAQPPTPGAPTAAPGGDATSAGEPGKEGEGQGEGESDQPIAVFVPEAPNGDKLISMSFDQADIDHVLKFLAEQSGHVIVKDPTVQTKVTITSAAKITVADAFRILQALLSVKGYAIVEDEDQILRVVPKATASQQPMRLTTGDDEIDPTDEYVTHVYQVEYVDATTLKDDLAPLVPDGTGHLIANGDTNTLIIIDTGRAITRLLDIIKQIDTDRTEVTKVEVIPLEFSDAEELAENLSQLFESDDDALSGLPRDVRRRMQAAMRGGGGPPGAEAAMTASSGLLDAKGQVKIVAETRTNSLIVSASEANVGVIQDIVAKVDVDMSPDVQAKIIPLKYADPETVADQIGSLFEESSSSGGSFFSRMFSRGRSSSYGSSSSSTETSGLVANQVVADVRTRSVIVTADEENLIQITKLIEQLDTTAEIEEVVRAVPLENAVAEDVAQTISDLLSGSQSGGFFFFALMGSDSNSGESPLDQLSEVNVVADSPTNTILLTGPPETFATLERLIKQLDRRVPQVYIEVLIADVTLDDGNQLGMEWSLIDRNLLGNGSASGTAATSWDGMATSSTGLSYSLISNSVQAFMQTLEERTDVEILSSPNIIASDNTPATLSIGEEIPYQESTAETSGGSIQQTIGFVDVATTLEVTPHVNQRERVSLDVSQTIDALIDFDEQLLAPRTAKREAETTVEVRDGQTVIIGGMISKKKSISIQGVPILRKIPIIGKLFESKERQTARTELLVFLTPHIIVDDLQIDALTEAQSRRLSNNPLDDEELRPLDIPLADVEKLNMFQGDEDGTQDADSATDAAGADDAADTGTDAVGTDTEGAGEQGDKPDEPTPPAP